MPAPVPRQERDFLARQLSHHDSRPKAGPTELSSVTSSALLKPGMEYKTAAANNPDGWFHSCINSSKTPPVEEGCTKT